MTEPIMPTALPAAALPAAVITAENVTKLVKLYFTSQLMTLNSSAFSKFCIACGTDAYLNGNTVSSAYLSNYDVFWAIRLLVETSKYDFDDIEFHVKHNPIFADLHVDDIEDSHGGQAKPPNQSRLLRQAINTYKQEAEKKDRAEKKALAKQLECRDAATVSSIAANRLTNLILIGSKL
jgi:hypothetical protein